MNKTVIFGVGGVLALAFGVVVILYISEMEKNTLLRTETVKTSEEASKEVTKIEEEARREKKKNLEEKEKLVAQMNEFSRERDAAEREAEDLQKRFQEEREFSTTANKDLNALEAEVAKLRRENKESIIAFDTGFKKKKQEYESRILSAEAELDKVKKRLSNEAERYHYNLGVLYTQNKDYETAVAEFKKTLGYNPNAARAHYNLGILFDDYFKDKENARYHYRAFLELQSNSDDTESVREWLKNLDNNK